MKIRTTLARWSANIKNCTVDTTRLLQGGHWKTEGFEKVIVCENGGHLLFFTRDTGKKSINYISNWNNKKFKKKTCVSYKLYFCFMSFSLSVTSLYWIGYPTIRHSYETQIISVFACATDMFHIEFPIEQLVELFHRLGTTC